MPHFLEEIKWLFTSLEYLALMQSRVDTEQEATWLRLFVRRTNKNRSPLRHVLFLQFLGVSLKELFETERVIGRKKVAINRKPIYDLEERRKAWMKIVENNPEATRSELKQIGKGLHTWIYTNDWDWYDQVTPKFQTRKKRRSDIDWQKRDEESLVLAKKGHEILMNKEGKPIRIVPSNIRRAVGVKKWFFHEKLIKTKQFLNEVYEDIENYRIRKIKWAIEDRIEKGEPLTVYKVQLHAGFGGNNKTIKQTILEILKNY
ncbi:TnsD family Tn7-like transposition protein [Bacillus canaveralius]|uniref:TnsD family Tn7-like transposition protein n=1 Tax=Bacillus canaveralius TaxID=1403243 RepID=UPI000F76F901|nr:TnsD family Tn7-like transposition protein [Bacillus canaveralius]RSK44983.1 hypothetical protein EJA13_20215 [Bacillus canaveralius]